MAADVYGFSDYRDYMKIEFSGKGSHRGRRALLARSLNCQTSFLSQVLTERAHLSLEHALSTSLFLKHSETEKEFFMLLVQKAKAGTRDLRSFYDSQLERIRIQRENIKERIQVETELTMEDQMRYYSCWYYAAIHVLTALPTTNTVEAISTALRLDPSIIKDTLEFLEHRGFVIRKQESYKIGSRRIHLDRSSPMLPRHHSNWRVKAIESVDNQKKDDLHYSAVLGISRKDMKSLKTKILDLLEEFEPTLLRSQEEVPVILLMDFFEL